MRRIKVPAAVALACAGIAMSTAREVYADEYEAHLDRAAALLDQDRCEEALGELQAAYAIKQAPRILYERGRALRKLGDARGALSSFERFLAANDWADPAVCRDAEEAAATLRALVSPPATERPPFMAPSLAELPPRTLKWNEGEMIPRGYHPGTEVRKGLVIAGSITFGVSYMFTGLYAALLSAPVGAIPIAGPFVLAGQSASGSGSAAGVLVFDGIVQAGSLAMLIAGMAARRPVLLRDDVTEARSWWMPRPITFGARGGGLGALGTF